MHTLHTLSYLTLVTIDRDWYCAIYYFCFIPYSVVKDILANIGQDLSS